MWEKATADDLYATVYVDAGLLVSLNGERQPGRKFQLAAQWAAQLFLYELFWRTHGRRPRERTSSKKGVPTEERRLANWARYQKPLKEDLTEFRRIRLDISPAFAWEPSERNWADKLEACIRHVQNTRQLPRLNPDDPEEWALARWFKRELKKLKEGTLPRERVVPLAALIALEAKKRTDTDLST
ncbi:hypothetical protein [Homoserinimonas sp. OAct 916]|uniref:hypothetical protein n=1 Tax=Homoserinimonas sp. OAct 916 TaxID=2211450 RepID=UPI000DBE1400|nr:hypothetical protein [Homoserinimonas sp. OAct 916]